MFGERSINIDLETSSQRGQNCSDKIEGSGLSIAGKDAGLKCEIESIGGIDEKRR